MTHIQNAEQSTTSNFNTKYRVPTRRNELPLKAYTILVMVVTTVDSSVTNVDFVTTMTETIGAGRASLTLTALKYFCTNHVDQRVFPI